MKVVPLIISGGSGKRLWPLSRENYPKQFLKFDSEHSLLQDTLLRIKNIKGTISPVIICNDNHRFLVAEQFRKLNYIKPHIILESKSNNTATAIALATSYIKRNFGEVLVLVLSSDHLIPDRERFKVLIESAIDNIDKEKLFLFAVKPESPNTGYGYIKTNEMKGNQNFLKVTKFIEKPSISVAKKIFKENNIFWNSGIFLYSTTFFYNEMRLYANEYIDFADKLIDEGYKDLDFFRLPADIAYPEALPIDKALIERSKKIYALKFNNSWSDIGTWKSLFDSKTKDANFNAIKGNVISLESSNSLIHSNSNHLIATIGVDNLIIVNTDDVTFISSIDKINKLEDMLKLIGSNDKEKLLNNRKVYRPWGWYDSLDKETGFHIKRIHVFPGERLSLQSHAKRSEHWIVVRGKAEATVDDCLHILKENDSIDINVGSIHSLKNLSKKNPLELVEVQTGDYFGEDDIIRYDDIYGRSDNK